MSESTKITAAQESLPERASERAVTAPPVDIYENDDEIMVVADMPGVSSDTINVRFDKDVLVIEGATKDMEGELKALAREFTSTDFRRSFQLAPVVDFEKIAAEIKSGVLIIHLPKSAAVKPRQIKITTS